MSVLELKQEITRLNQRGREEIHAYIVRLQHGTPQWKRATAQRLRAMRKGQGVSAQELERRISSRNA